jgi:tetratricopeptide (TPR) repeat protein
MLRRFLLPPLLLLLVGCAGLQESTREPLLKAPATAAEARAVADDMVSRGRWSLAFAVLDAAAHDFPDDLDIEAHRNFIRERWQRQQRVYEDQIMVGDAENQNNKITVLEKLSLAEPEDLILTARRIYWKEVLASNIEPLTACGEYHVTVDTALARRCFELARGLFATPDIERRLAGVDEQLRLSESIAEERRRASKEKERQHRAKVLLGEAKAAIDARNYRRALDILEKLAKLQPDNSEVQGLQQEALSMISPQVEALIKLGDHLYLDEQLDAAVATWQAALTLKPDDEALIARIDRAKKVLNRLDALRRQQQPDESE